MIDPFKETFARGLRGTWTHPDPLAVIEKISFEDTGKKVEGYPLTIWQISSHLLEWGWQIVNKLKGIESKNKPDENNFFPKEDAPDTETVWQTHQEAMRDLISETNRLLPDLNPEMRFLDWDNISGTDMLMILTAHNSYHISQIIVLLKILGKWDSLKVTSGDL